jgi:hypothetical protein
MKTKTIPARKTALSLVPASESQTPNAEFLDDFRDLCSSAMDRAIGIEKASLAAAVDLNSSVIDIYKNAFWFAPVFGEILDTAAKSFESCMKLQMNWLTLMVPHAEGSASSLSAAAPSSTVASSFGNQAQSTAEELAHSMDIAIGEGGSTQINAVTSISGGQAQPAAEAPERTMEIAMTARAA